MSAVAEKPAANLRGWSGIAPLLLVLVAAFVIHIAIGAKLLPLSTVFDALFNFDPQNFDHTIVRKLRLSRAVLSIVVGASLAVAGALMQGVTRNPLADPGLLGLTAGASFAVVIAISVFGMTSMGFIPLIASAGALAAAAVVYLIARWVPGGATPLSLTLSGAAISAFLGALISIAHLLGQDTFENLRVWLTGSLAGRSLELLLWTGPWIAAAMLASLVLARQVTVLSMGDDVALGLGVNTRMLRIQLIAAVVVLTASAVAIAGPLGFVGLVIPHAVRLYVGADYRWIVPYSALVGGAYLLVVDIIARVAIIPREVSTGLITAMIGAPLFIYLVSRRAK
jgi:iron complex transport system permease protein